jgi:serine O-acetyltransferase
MIESKKDYIYYLEADRIALREQKKRPKILGDEVWKFEKLLRKNEYLKNCCNSPIKKISVMFYYFKFHYLSLKLGFEIPLNVFGPGLSIAHKGPIIVNKAAKVGENCRIHNMVTIGANNGQKFAPQIGNNVFIGPCATIFGNIFIADGIAIGANSVVNKTFYEKDIGIAGVPAKKINNIGSKLNVVKATELIVDLPI